MGFLLEGASKGICQIRCLTPSRKKRCLLPVTFSSLICEKGVQYSRKLAKTMEFENCSEEQIKSIESIRELLCGLGVDAPDDWSQTRIILTSDIVAENQKHAPLDQLGDPDEIARLNGRIIMPHDASREFIVLIKSEVFDSDQYLHTVAHELTHLADYYAFSKEVGSVYGLVGNEAAQHSFGAFYLWSEFHAKRVGTIVYATISWHNVNGPEPPENSRYSFSSVDLQTDVIRKRLVALREARRNDCARPFWGVLEEMAAYLGRLSAFDEGCSPKDKDPQYPFEEVDQLLGDCDVCSIYRLFKTGDSYSKVKAVLPAVQYILYRIELNLRRYLDNRRV